MRVQKVYNWYCGISWFLWLLTLILTVFSGNGYHIRNEALYIFVCNLSRVLTLVSFIPVHPVLCIMALHWSNKNNRVGYSIFNGTSFIFTTVLAILLFLNQVALSGA